MASNLRKYKSLSFSPNSSLTSQIGSTYSSVLLRLLVKLGNDPEELHIYLIFLPLHHLLPHFLILLRPWWFLFQELCIDGQLFLKLLLTKPFLFWMTLGSSYACSSMIDSDVSLPLLWGSSGTCITSFVIALCVNLVNLWFILIEWEVNVQVNKSVGTMLEQHYMY